MNTAYTRFQNALMVLREAQQFLEEDPKSSHENKARNELIDLCGEIYMEKEYGE